MSDITKVNIITQNNRKECIAVIRSLAESNNYSQKMILEKARELKYAI